MKTSGAKKPDKVPYRAAEPSRRASSTDPATWAPFEDAVAAYQALTAAGRHHDRHPWPVSGITAALKTDAGLTCVDLDGAIDAEGGLDPHAETIVRAAASWTEYSPSGAGLHIWVRGRVARAIPGVGIEVYSERRFICVTGRRWPGAPDVVNDGQVYLDLLYERYQAHARREAHQQTRSTWTGPRTPPPDDLAGALLATLQRWGVAFGRLKPWQGGFLVELEACPWAEEHTSGPGGAAVLIHPSGARDFTCLHAHCHGRSWRDFKAIMEGHR